MSNERFQKETTGRAVVYNLKLEVSRQHRKAKLNDEGPPEISVAVAKN